MQMSRPRPCPDCNDGKKPDGKICIICLGSGRVHLVPALRTPIDYTKGYSFPDIDATRYSVPTIDATR